MVIRVYVGVGNSVQTLDLELGRGWKQCANTIDTESLQLETQLVISNKFSMNAPSSWRE